MKNLLPLALLGLLTFACTDDDSKKPASDGIILNKAYTSSYIQSDTVRLFTKQGEVLDSDAKADFIQRHTMPSDISQGLGHPFERDLNSEDLFTEMIFAEDSAIFNMDIPTPSGLGNQSGSKYSYQIHDNFIELTFPDTFYIPNEFVIPNFTPDITLHAGVYSEVVPDPYNEGKYIRKSVIKQYAYIEGGKIKIPLLYTHWKLNPNNLLNYPQYPGNNEFDENSYPNFDEGDTLLLRQAYLILE